MTVSLDYDGRIVLVTGGTRGVGRGVAQRFADAGATVAVCARQEVDDLPDDWTFFNADLREGEAAWAMIDAVVERLGRLDVLVNNAGISHAGKPGRSLEEIVKAGHASVASTAPQVRTPERMDPLRQEPFRHLVTSAPAPLFCAPAGSRRATAAISGPPSRREGGERNAAPSRRRGGEGGAPGRWPRGAGAGGERPGRTRR
jgi:NAD(P)-dependent dehydrogenase (short-subunit alcohol dehydrogenase family)